MRLQGAMLTEPDVNLSAHPALAIQPSPDAANANGRIGVDRVPPSSLSIVPPVGDALAL